MIDAPAEITVAPTAGAAPMNGLPSPPFDALRADLPGLEAIVAAEAERQRAVAATASEPQPPPAEPPAPAPEERRVLAEANLDDIGVDGLLPGERRPEDLAEDEPDEPARVADVRVETTPTTNGLDRDPPGQVHPPGLDPVHLVPVTDAASKLAATIPEEEVAMLNNETSRRIEPDDVDYDENFNVVRLKPRQPEGAAGEAKAPKRPEELPDDDEASVAAERLSHARQQQLPPPGPEDRGPEEQPDEEQPKDPDDGIDPDESAGRHEEKHEQERRRREEHKREEEEKLRREEEERRLREARAKSPFPLIPFNELQVGTTPAYLVKGLLPRVGLGVAWGPPKCGKSFWFFDLLCHVALGWIYRNKRVQPGIVVYCAFEGAAGFHARAEAFRRKHNLETKYPVPLYVMPMRADLVREHEALINAIRDQLPADASPVAVGLDTLNRSLAGSESNDEDMSAYVNAADAIREAFYCFVGIVHHCGIDGTRPRGHTSLTGAIDVQIAVSRDTSDNIVATVEHMKDGPAGETLISRLEVVEMGLDSEGDLITSCAVTAGEAAARGGAERKGKLPPAAQIALGALTEAIIELGSVPAASNHIPLGTKAVTIEQWRDYAYRRGISNSDEPRARQQAFNRAGDALRKAARIGTWHPFVWLI